MAKILELLSKKGIKTVKLCVSICYYKFCMFSNDEV